jgi:hypothetical protein
MALMVSALEIAQRTGSPLKELFAASASYVGAAGRAQARALSKDSTGTPLGPGRLHASSGNRLAPCLHIA